MHIGFPKSAMTTLQTYLLAKHPSIANVARPFANARVSEACTSLALADDMGFDESGVAALAAEARTRALPLLVYSDETVANSPICSIAAKRLKRLFSDAQILAILHKQLDDFAAHYANSGSRSRPAPEPFSGRHVDFENYLAFHHANPKRAFFTALGYNQTIEIYGHLFGHYRVHVLLFEEFLHNRPAFVSKISGILGLAKLETINLLASRHEHKQTTEAVGQYQAFRSQFLWGVPLSWFLPGSRYIKQALFCLWSDKPLNLTYSDS